MLLLLCCCVVVDSLSPMMEHHDDLLDPQSITRTQRSSTTLISYSNPPQPSSSNPPQTSSSNHSSNPPQTSSSSSSSSSSNPSEPSSSASSYGPSQASSCCSSDGSSNCSYSLSPPSYELSQSTKVFSTLIKTGQHCDRDIIEELIQMHQYQTEIFEGLVAVCDSVDWYSKKRPGTPEANIIDSILEMSRMRQIMKIAKGVLAAQKVQRAQIMTKLPPSS
jgi:hypothetical protein